MREIKFRAWNKNTNSIVYGTPIFYKDGSFTLYEIKESKSVGYGVINCGRCKNICQYTGLHDKNGNEIYEGDILKYEWDGKTKIDYIVFNGGMFTYSKCVRWSLNEDEIIGNIYENSELLEEQS